MSSETIYSHKKFHYVYRITNTVEHKYYYGVHSCNDLSTEAIGIKYLSSSTDEKFLKDQKENPSHYQYKIIRFFNTREDAISFEVFLHEKFDVKNHPAFYNNANQTSTGFDSTGKVPVKDKDGKTFIVSKTDPRYLSGEFVHSSKGKTLVKDKEGNTLYVAVNDPRYISRELIGYHKGVVRSVETRKKMSKANKGSENPNYGKTHSDATRQKISNTHKGKIVTAETRMKKSKAMKEYWKNRKLLLSSD